MRRRSHASRHHSPASDRALRFEHLETRALLSAVPVGTEFPVNSWTTGDQGSGSVATDADGDFVAVWQSGGSQDGSSWGIYAQRYDADGVAQGGEFPVNSYTTSAQELPTVAMDADGDFVVAWQSYGQLTSLSVEIYAQRYDRTGAAQGVEFQVNTRTTSHQFAPSVAMDAAGNFVVTWGSNSGDGSGAGVYGQRYTADGMAQGVEFRINTYTTNAQNNPAVAMDSDGDFVVAWVSTLEDGHFGGIYARYYSTGGPPSAAFPVNTTTTGNQYSPAVDMDADGDFVITWSGGPDGDYGVFAQRYNSSGAAVGGEFLVNSHTTNTQRYSAVAMSANGEFVIAWESSTQEGGTGPTGVYAQQYDAAGVAQGGEFHVNTYTTNGQAAPALAMDSDGDFVVIWSSGGQDGNGSGMYAQRYSLESALPVYPGDYNRNGVVDAADYVVWRKQSGATGVPPYSGADGDGNGDVDPDDYDVWTLHFGEIVPPGSGAGAAAASSLLTAGEVPQETVSAMFATPLASFLPGRETDTPRRRPQRSLAAVHEVWTKLDVDSLLVSATAASLDNEYDLNSAPARTGREHEPLTHAAELDDVFNDFCRSTWHGIE